MVFKKVGKSSNIDAHRLADDASARLDVLHVATETITITRTFGMVPVSQNDIVSPAMLERVVVAANAFVKVGASLDPALLEGTTLVAVKRFYAAARKVSWLDATLEATRLRERAWRCASHVAFYALQEHQRRCTVIPAIVSTMQGMSLSTIREKQFPSKELLDTACDALKDSDLPAGCLSFVYLSNMARHARHLLERALRSSAGEAILRSIDAIRQEPGSIVEQVVTDLSAGMENVPVAIVRAVSRRLTRRVKERARGRGILVGKHRLDAVIDVIMPCMDLATWQQARRAWRDMVKERLAAQVKDLCVPTLATEAVNDVLANMSLDEALAVMFSNRTRPGVIMPRGIFPDARRVLLDRAMTVARNQIGVALWTLLAPDVNAVLASIGREPEMHVALPCCKKHAIPIAIDDGQVYQLDRREDASNGRTVAAEVRFSLEPGMISTFSLHGLDRIDALLARGFTPTRGTITRKPGGGLLLHLPFEKTCTIRAFPGSIEGNGGNESNTFRVAGVDLGIKHLAWVSIGDCRRSSRGDGSLESVDATCPEIARRCIDQPQLFGTKDAWLTGTISTSSNVKRQLIATINQARLLQRQKDLLRQRFGKRCKHVMRYFVTRREWQRCWRRVRHLHEEMARQVATRIVAACVHHGVELLRFEDLSWSSHASKRESGSWLASWQVHWFFSQVQERATRLARLAGIAVELVDARGTSKRCSACGVVGIRDGKRFSCTNEDCGTKVDSDLNGSRNVRIAQSSPRLHAKVEGARFRPLACHA